MLCRGSIIELIQEYYAAPKEIAEFLKFVVEGEQDQAEAMLKSNADLALVPGDVMDLSKRKFTNITGFQYALWAFNMLDKIVEFLQSNAQRVIGSSHSNSSAISGNLHVQSHAGRDSITIIGDVTAGGSLYIGGKHKHKHKHYDKPTLDEAALSSE